MPHPLCSNHLILPCSSRQVQLCLNPVTSQRYHMVQQTPPTSRAFTLVAPRSQSGGLTLSVSQLITEPASLIPVFPFASPLMPGVMSSTPAFHFLHEQWFNFFFFYSLYFQNSYSFSFLGTTSSYFISSILLYGCSCLLYLFGLIPPEWVMWFWAMSSLMRHSSGSWSYVTGDFLT